MLVRMHSNWNFPILLVKKNITANLTSELRPKKTGKEKVKLFADDIIVYVENTKEFRKQNYKK